VALRVLGVNHRTAPLEVRERFAHAAHEVPGALSRVVGGRGAAGGVLLSTCNRTEFYLTDPPAGAPDAVWTLLSDRLGAPAQPYGYERSERDTVLHLYRVVSGLDSIIVGEPQIQGQVKTAWETSRDFAGPVLHRLFHSALRVGARVRAETALGRGSASAPSAAVELARKIFGKLDGRRALVLGAGDVAELALQCLMAEGVRTVMVANRTYERAVALAEQVGARAIRYDEAWPLFAEADIVICSTSAPRPVVTWERVAPQIDRRGGRPLCLFDLAMPRDVEPALGQFQNVFLYDVDDVQTVAAQALGRRRDHLPAAEQIVEEEALAFWTWHGALEVVPVIKAFRGRLEETREAELARILKRLDHLSPEDRAQLEQFSRALLNKFLHEPTVRLREAAERGRAYGMTEALRFLFRLDQP
jgi:glutamyl-tRNA reductase